MHTSTLSGIHHVTAITGDAQANLDFYTQALGLRLVKRTVNFDDPGSYHLYYGDAPGHPGTIITFFAWPHARRGTASTGQVTETAFAIPRGKSDWWQRHLSEKNIAARRATRFGRSALLLEDPDGLPLALIEAETTAGDAGTLPSTAIPADAAIRAFHGVTLLETRAELPASVLVDQFGYREVAREQQRIRYEAPGGGVARYVDVVVTPERSIPRIGAGQVHHVAFRTPTDEQQAEWLQLLRDQGHNVSPVMDREYFHSIYFREPGGTLFEIATDSPGFAIDESPETLGTGLKLPPWLESDRAAIEKALPPLVLSGASAPAILSPTS